MPAIAKLWNTPLKNGSNSNMAVNGSSTPVEFSLTASASMDYDIQCMCLIAEFSGSLAIGNKFISDSIGTLSNGLLVEAKTLDTTYTLGTFKRTRDLLEVSNPQSGFNAVSGTTSLVQIFFYLPPFVRMCKQGTYTSDDFVKATVRDNLTGLNYMEMFLQGVKV